MVTRAGGGDGGDVARDLNGSGTAGGGAVAELAVEVLSHAPGAAVGFEEQAVSGASSHGGHGAGDLHGGGPVACGSIAQLARGV